MSSSDARLAARQMKAKGLQRLKFYCQSCEKQCRDEHGFKLHIQSPSHTARAQKGDVNKWSKEFEQQFFRVLRSSSGTVTANKLYNELIHDKSHVRLHSTRWRSLYAFIKHLESIGALKIVSTDPELVVEYTNPAHEAALHRKAAAIGERQSAEQQVKDTILAKQLSEATKETKEDITETKEGIKDIKEGIENPKEDKKEKARSKISFSLK